MRERHSETERESKKRGNMVRVRAHARACARTHARVFEKERAHARA